MMPFSSPETLVAGKYQLQVKLGSGGFGTVFKGRNVQEDLDVAIKVETESRHHLQNEARIYKKLAVGDSCGIPKVHWHGLHDSNYVMVADMLGKSLKELFNEQNKKFTLKTMLMLAERMIARLQYVHSQGYLHRDVKPDNFMCGREGDTSSIYIIDFGLAKQYLDPESKAHIELKTGKRGLTGTARFASTNLLNGMEPSRRDGLLSIGYVLAMFNLNGDLPWRNVELGSKRANREEIARIKAATPLSDLFRGLPPEFERFMEYCTNLRFEEQPDYDRWRTEFKNRLLKEGYSDDSVFDWVDVGLPATPPISAISVGVLSRASKRSHSVPAAQDALGPACEKNNEEDILTDGGSDKVMLKAPRQPVKHDGDSTVQNRVDGVCPVGPFTLAQLQDPSVWQGLGVPPTQREAFLEDEVFNQVFEMTRDEFAKMPPWRRDIFKKKVDLF